MSQREKVDCPSCGLSIENPKCQSDTHDPCFYLCPDCNYRLLLDPDQPTFGVDVTLNRPPPWFPSSIHRQLARRDFPIDPEVSDLIGRIIVLFAWAENLLWNLLPEASRGELPRFSSDLDALEKLKASWCNWAIGVPGITAEGVRDVTVRHIDEVRALYDDVVKDRNVLAHGALLSAIRTRYSLSACGEDIVRPDLVRDQPAFMARHQEPGYEVAMTADRLELALTNVEHLLRGVMMLKMSTVTTWGRDSTVS